MPPVPLAMTPMLASWDRSDHPSQRALSASSTASNRSSSPPLAQLGSPAALALEVCDDGAGLSAGYQAGIGLASMWEQAAELGTTITEAVGHAPDHTDTTHLARQVIAALRAAAPAST
jgi:hypothetical protein